MGGKKPLRRPLWPPTRATASNYYPLGLDGAGGAAKPLLRAPKKPAPLHGRLPAFSGAVDAFERARKCFLEWRYFFSIILSEFLKNRVALQSTTISVANIKNVIKKYSPSARVNGLNKEKLLQLLEDIRKNNNITNADLCNKFADEIYLPKIVLKKADIPLSLRSQFIDLR